MNSPATFLMSIMFRNDNYEQVENVLYDLQVLIDATCTYMIILQEFQEWLGHCNVQQKRRYN